MKRSVFLARTSLVLCGCLVVAAATAAARAEPLPAAAAAFDAYVGAVEGRLARQHRSPDAFLVPVASAGREEISLRRGDPVLEQLTPPTGKALPGALLHHWRGTAFVPRATAADFERLIRDIDAYPRHFSPQVLQARVLSQHEDRLEATMRVRQRHVMTVVMDTTCEVAFGRLDARHGYSLSRSTHVAEIDSPGTAAEHELGPTVEHGFLWRQNTYWSYEERDGGLYLQVESVSLTRSIPRGLGWAVEPFVQSIPRDTLEFTLRSASDAIRR